MISMMNKTLRTVLITLFSFGLYFLVDGAYFYDFRNWLYGITGQLGISHIIVYSMVGIPVFLGTALLHPRKFLDSLGLSKSILTAVSFSLLCTLPMFIGFALLFEINTEFSLDRILITVLAAAFFEELYFRGFLFGQIYRYTSWGFFPSVLVGALLFGLIHLYQGTGPYELIGIFLITFLGGILYAWSYVEWNYNLWVPIFLHLLMNLSWGMFSVADNALGGTYANIFRGITILLIIGLTIGYKLKKRESVIINKRTLLKKSSHNRYK